MTTAQKLKGVALYEQLGELGKSRHPLDPVMVSSREAVCECRAVTSRAGSDATDDQRTNDAINAIKDAVASIRDKRNRLIASAIFGLGIYEGKSVGERRTLLYSKEHISIHEFDKHRADAVGAVVHYLRAPHTDVSIGRSPSTTSAAAVPEHVMHLTYLARGAAQLHFNALASLFVYNNVPEIDDLGQLVITTEVSDAMEELFHSFVDMMVRPFRVSVSSRSSNTWEVSQKYSTQKALKQSFRSATLASQLPPNTEDEILRLYSSLVRWGSPFTQQQITDLTLRMVSSYAFERIETASQLHHEFEISWLDWFLEALEASNAPKEVGRTGRPSPIELMAAKSGRIARAIGEHVEFQTPVLDEAQWLARKKLAVSFRVDEWEPYKGGLPFGKRVDTYFENMRAALARDSIVWFDSGTKKK